jgi:hypothetical protein
MFVLSALLASSVCAFAVDGVVLINQSTVTAGGGFPYRITQPGSYELSGNLTVPLNLSAIVIAHDDVVLNLNGFTITGPGVFPNLAPAVVGTDFKRITVRNGSISGFVEGLVFLGNSRFIVLESLNVDATTSNAAGTVAGLSVMIGRTYSAFAIIRDSIFVGQVQLTCPSLVVNTSLSAAEINVPFDGGGVDFPTKCTGAHFIFAPDVTNGQF